VNYCSQCGNAVNLEIPPQDNKPRHVCSHCGAIHYQNPKPVVGCLPELDGRLLLCRRAIEPRYGLWTLPAGFMETGETVQAGAARETLEESGATVEVNHLYAMFSLPHVSQIYLLFRSRVIAQDTLPGNESLEIGFFNEKDLPWSNLAFPVIRETLWLYWRDYAHGAFNLHTGNIIRTSGQLRRYRVHLYS
jgi:ADP-ribose pyrophosphatase YjhB (NUDIX family)